jgi:chromosome segregation ATPase
MMGFKTVLLILLVVCICHTYQSTTQRTQRLKENVEALQEKFSLLEKAATGKGPCRVKTNDAELKTEFSQLNEKISSLRAEIERLENLLKAHKEEDQEDKLCLIEGMKRIGKLLGLDSGLSETGEETTNAASGSIKPRKLEEGDEEERGIYACGRAKN